MSTPVIRGSTMQSGIGASFNVAFPTGTVVGDLVIIFGNGGYNFTNTPPTGWTKPLSTEDAGAIWSQIFLYKVMTSGDISTGYVTVTSGGSFNTIFGVVAFVGNPGAVRVCTGAVSEVYSAGIDGNGIMDANNLAISFTGERGSGSDTITASVGTTLQSVQDGTAASALMTNLGAGTGGFPRQTWTYSVAGSTTTTFMAIVGPVPAVAPGIPTLVEKEFGDQIEPWSLQGLESGRDLNLGQVEVGDIVVVGYTFGGAGSGPIDISDTNSMAWQILYQDTQTSYWVAAVTVAAASSVITFSYHGYSQNGRLLVIRGASAANTNVVANSSTQPIALTLGDISVSYTYYPDGGAWASLMMTIPGLFQNITVLMSAVVVYEVTHGNPGSIWTETFPEDDSFLDVFTYITLVPQSVQLLAVKVTVYYQNPGNFLYARDVNSWGDGGVFGQNNGIPYADCNIVIGSIQLSQLGAPLFALQHLVGYFDAVGTLGAGGGPSRPDIWLLPNEISGEGVNEPRFVQLPEILQEPPDGQNHPSATIQALRWPVNMMNSQQYSQLMHHLQVKIQFEPENAPNTIKAIAFKEDQS